MSRDDTYLVDILESAKIALDYVSGNMTFWILIKCGIQSKTNFPPSSKNYQKSSPLNHNMNETEINWSTRLTS